MFLSLETATILRHNFTFFSRCKLLTQYKQPTSDKGYYNAYSNKLYSIFTYLRFGSYNVAYPETKLLL